MNHSRARAFWRRVDGILLLDKPRGLSSNQALQQARRLYAAEKAGHTGSLDPLATGMLPLCFGEATKIAGVLLAGRKAYEVVAHFGVETDTADAEGGVLARRAVPKFTFEQITAALQPFHGRIQQVPPIYSALKRQGEPLYVKARRGEQVEIPAREVEIYTIELLELGSDSVRLRIECGAGTYIRSLVRDLGAVLGCGAHVAALRRLWVEPFRQAQMTGFDPLLAAAAHTPQTLDALLLPVEAGLSRFPRLQLDSEQIRRLAQGQAVAWPHEAEIGEGVAYSASGCALGLVRVDPGRLTVRRLFRWAASAQDVEKDAANRSR